MAKALRFILVLSVSAVLLFFSNCKKDAASVSNLSFSTDTLTFDTVFTTLGSTTQYFKVFNHSRQPLTINSIKLQQLQGTQYRINVDGIAGTSFTNVQIPGRDSIYIFVEVTVNPNSTATPFVIIDNVNFTIGNTTETVFLQAFGQNAHFHYGETVYAGHTETWNNDLPHVILGTNSIPGVYVECGATLNIKPGCKVLFQANSALFVQGTLNAVAHDWHDSIIFRGVRLEQYYQDLPGQWFGIVFLRSNSCVAQGNFNHCVVNESQYGIYAGAISATVVNATDFLGTEQMPVINIQKSIVSNSQYNAIYGFNANITAENSLFYTSGDNLVKLALGGVYNFTNCTMYNFGNSYVSHQTPILLLSNVLGVTYAKGTTFYPQPLTSTFTNCAIYGNLPNEITFSNFDNLDLARFNNSFSYCLMTTPADTLAMFSTTNTKNLFNQNPLFNNASANIFTLSDSTNNSSPVSGYFSPLIDYCPTGFPTDLYDHPRPVSKTSNPFKYDIGAIEAQ